LNEQKTTIINQAVTKGLDPKVKMKESGIEWLGEIPEHWEVRKLKYIADFQSGEMITSEIISEAGEYPVYGGGGFRGYTNAFTNDGLHVLIGRQGALCGNIKYAEGKFWASEHAIVTYPKIKFETYFLGEILRIANLGRLSQTAAQPGIAIGQIKHVKIPIPSLSEQTVIVSYFEKETAQLNQTIANIEKELALVEEYKTALIAEAVTGKIDVRDYEISRTEELEENLIQQEFIAEEEPEVEYETE
jgi:type I restriction enzyme S subunit